MKVAATPVGIALLLMMLGSGCGRGGPARQSTLGPSLLGTPVSQVDEEGDGEGDPREPDLGPRERWGAPFSVTSAGEITPTEPRSVIVLEVDPAIEEGMKVQQAIQATLPSRLMPVRPQSSSSPATGQDILGANESRNGPEGQPTDGQRPGDEPRPNDVQRPDSRVMPAPSPG